MPRRRFRYHEKAEAELDEAAAWYDEQREGLGGEFIAAVDARIHQIVEAPKRWPLVAGSRRALITRFPYVIVYRQLDDGMIQIVAVAHERRRPGYWRRR